MIAQDLMLRRGAQGQTNNEPYMAILKRLKLVRSGSRSRQAVRCLGLARFGLGPHLGAEVGR